MTLRPKLLLTKRAPIRTLTLSLVNCPNKTAAMPSTTSSTTWVKVFVIRLFSSVGLLMSLPSSPRWFTLPPRILSVVPLLVSPPIFKALISLRFLMKQSWKRLLVSKFFFLTTFFSTFWLSFFFCFLSAFSCMSTFPFCLYMPPKYLTLLE